MHYTTTHKVIVLLLYSKVLLNISLPMHFVTYVGVVRHVKPVHILYQATYRRSLSSVEYVVVDLISYSVLYT